MSEKESQVRAVLQRQDGELRMRQNGDWEADETVPIEVFERASRMPEEPENRVLHNWERHVHYVAKQIGATVIFVEPWVDNTPADAVN